MLKMSSNNVGLKLLVFTEQSGIIYDLLIYQEFITELNPILLK